MKLAIKKNLQYKGVRWLYDAINRPTKSDKAQMQGQGAANQVGSGDILKESTPTTKHQSGATKSGINKRSTRKDLERCSLDGGNNR